MSEYIYERPDEPAKVVRDGWNVRIEWDFKQREEIVRCRDCKHCKRRNGILPPTVCERWGYYNFETEPDGFCAWGERKDDGR